MLCLVVPITLGVLKLVADLLDALRAAGDRRDGRGSQD